MKRCLIIIGNQGTPSKGNFLPGVSRDVNNYLSFFKSNNGGAWENNEIIPKVYDWTSAGLYSTIYGRRMEGLDYAVIVFAGHGYALRNGETYFELSDGNDVSLSTIKSWFPTQKVLMIADSCQSFVNLYREGGILNEAFAQRQFSQHRNYLRNLYNSRIESVPTNAFTFASAVSPGEGANDTSKGGLYSYNLLNIANDCVNNTNIGGSVIPIDAIHAVAKANVMKKSNNNQHPQLTMTLNSRIYDSEQYSLAFPPFLVK